MIMNNFCKWTEINIVCEGRSEENFVKKVLNKYFSSKQIKLIPYRLKNSKSDNIGGNISIDRLIDCLCRCNTAVITTFVDYYGFKNNKDDVVHLENNILNEYNKKSKNSKILIPYVQMHEFEALLFSNVDIISEKMNANNDQKCELAKIIKEYDYNPEKINNSAETAPSKRLEKIFKGYKKTTDGIIISENIGLDKIKENCKKFNEWLIKIEEKVKELR